MAPHSDGVSLEGALVAVDTAEAFDGPAQSFAESLREERVTGQLWGEAKDGGSVLTQPAAARGRSVWLKREPEQDGGAVLEAGREEAGENLRGRVGEGRNHKVAAHAGSGRAPITVSRGDSDGEVPRGVDGKVASTECSVNEVYRGWDKAGVLHRETLRQECAVPDGQRGDVAS